MPISKEADEAFEDAVQFWVKLLEQETDSTEGDEPLRIKIQEYATWAGISNAAAARWVRQEAQRRTTG